MNAMLDRARFSSPGPLKPGREPEDESGLGIQTLFASGVQGPERSGQPEMLPSEMANGQVHPFPYATLIRRFIEKDQVPAARRLLQVALSQSPPSPDLSRWQVLLAPPVVRRGTETDVDRDLDYRWIDEKSRAYSGQWVAIFYGELLAHAATLKELLAELKLKPAPPAGKPLVFRVD